MPILILLISLVLVVPAWADDLGMAGAISGFSQGLSRGADQMGAGFIQYGLQQQRFEHERQMREQQYQYERQLQQTSQANKLNQEKQWLDGRKVVIDKRQQEIYRMKEAGNPQWEAEAMLYGKLVADNNLLVDAYDARLDQYYKYWNITPPQGYQQEAPQRQLAKQKNSQALVEAERHIQNSARTERITPVSIKGVSPEEALNSLRPGWRAIIGTPGSDAPYRQWLKRQPKAYQKLINDSASPEEINESIDEFLATQ
ncbi:MAG: hypothetical protein ABI955_11115 [Nitrospirota bacterium]